MSDGKKTYQVWHFKGMLDGVAYSNFDNFSFEDQPFTPRFPLDYDHVANVRATSLANAFQKTRGAEDTSREEFHGSGAYWEDNAGVEANARGARYIMRGDVIVDPQGYAHRLEGTGPRRIAGDHKVTEEHLYERIRPHCHGDEEPFVTSLCVRVANDPLVRRLQDAEAGLRPDPSRDELLAMKSERSASQAAGWDEMNRMDDDEVAGDIQYANLAGHLTVVGYQLREIDKALHRQSDYDPSRYARSARPRDKDRGLSR